MLLLHGALGAADQFEAVRAAITGRATHTFDFLGHGTCPLPPDGELTMDRLASQLVAFVQAHGLEGTPCFGYSMGGYVALVVAATRPGVLGPVTTLATKLAWTPESAAREVGQLDPAKIEAKVPRFAAALEARHTAAGWKALCAAQAKMLLALGAAPVLTPEVLARITSPVKLMVGDRDSLVTIEETVATYRAIPGAQLAVLPGTGHPLERVAPEVVARELVDG